MGVMALQLDVEPFGAAATFGFRVSVVIWKTFVIEKMTNPVGSNDR
jgi:hypothetical protein